MTAEIDPKSLHFLTEYRRQYTWKLLVNPMKSVFVGPAQELIEISTQTSQPDIRLAAATNPPKIEAATSPIDILTNSTQKDTLSTEDSATQTGLKPTVKFRPDDVVQKNQDGSPSSFKSPSPPISPQKALAPKLNDDRIIASELGHAQKDSSSELLETGKTREKPVKDAAILKPRPFVPYQKPDPLMHPYGQGNTKPAVPEHSLKTFNARAPSSEVYPDTLDRINRIRQFESEELRPPRTKPRQKIDVPGDVLEQYLAAKKLVDQMASRYKTEYARHFLDWSRPVPSKESAKGKKKVQILDDHAAAGVPSGVPLPGGKIAKPIRTEPDIRASKSQPERATSPIDYVRVQSIYQSLKPAGFKDPLEEPERGRRHFIPKDSYATDLERPKTWDLANDVLERAQRGLSTTEANKK